jgi:hypothetical protein
MTHCGKYCAQFKHPFRAVSLGLDRVELAVLPSVNEVLLLIAIEREFIDDC